MTGRADFDDPHLHTDPILKPKWQSDKESIPEPNEKQKTEQDFKSNVQQDLTKSVQEFTEQVNTSMHPNFMSSIQPNHQPKALSQLHQTMQDLPNSNPKAKKRPANPIAEGLNLNLWDLGANSSLHDYWEEYLDEADGIVFVIDVSDSEKISQLRGQLFTLLKEEKLKGLPLLIMLNKQDKRLVNDQKLATQYWHKFYLPDQVN